MTPPLIRGIAVVGLTVVVVACSRATAGSTAAGAAVPQATSAELRGEAAAIAQARADSARYPYTAADIAFMSGMIHHHAQAIVMASWAASHGASESVRTLCERIINTQKDEIRTMQQWLRDRGQPVPDPTAGPMKMVMNGQEQEMLMPGMLSDEQMKALDAARGVKFDKLFLTGMIQHHSGAIQMVKDLFGSYGAGQDQLVFKLASDINVDQTTEIARMQRMLTFLELTNPGQ